MIRIRKPVKLLEWGEGTNTTNQVWTVAGEGRISKYVMKDGVTTLTIEFSQHFVKKNDKDNKLKLAQQGEGMAAASTRWGEVAMGILKTIESGGRVVQVVIPTATKIDARKSVPAWEEQPAQEAPRY